MDRSQWIRDPGKVHAALADQADGSLVARKDVKIYIPGRFVEKELADIGAEVNTLGVFAIVVDDKYYAVSTVNAKMRLAPASVKTVKVDDETYLELDFPSGTVVVADTLLLCDNTLVFRIFDEIIARGRVPFYLDYEDLGKLFDTAEFHALVGFDRVHSVLEMFAAVISRDPTDRTKYYRHIYKERQGKPITEPTFIAFRSITYGATNTTARLMGSYFDEGLASALNNPSKSNEAIEDMLRQ